jgi:hypothetical protein
MTDDKNKVVPLSNTKDEGIGYKRPPVHSRFKPGQSGNPTGRAKGSQNLKTLFHKILKEEVSLREGTDVRKVSKAEAIMRGLVVGALKGDGRSIGTLFRVAEQSGEFNEPESNNTNVRRIIVSWQASEVPPQQLPASSDVCKDKP